MNPTEPINLLNPSDERMLQTLQKQQRRLRWLTGVGVALWVLSVITSIGVLVIYSVLYAPKERKLLADYGEVGHMRIYANPAATNPAEDQRSANIENALGVHFTMNYVVTKGLLAVAISVVILSCATLATLLLVILNRRVTLGQINHSLARISDQLKALQDRRAG